MQKLIFKTLLTHVKQNNFLPASGEVINRSWTGTDQEWRYKENLSTQSSDWYYRTAPVKYTVNSDGYRTKEFKKINWSESVVLFGCSNVYGVGLDDKDTLASRLENIIGVPVINMGQGATSVNYNLHNSVILANGYPTPKAVVQVWPNYNRCVYYQNKFIKNHGPWDMAKDSYIDLWTRSDSNPKINAIIAQTTFRQIWQDRTSIYECSFDAQSVKLFECVSYRNPDKTKWNAPAYQDWARDLMHPGIETIKWAAEDIASKLCIN